MGNFICLVFHYTLANLLGLDNWKYCNATEMRYIDICIVLLPVHRPVSIFISFIAAYIMSHSAAIYSTSVFATLQLMQMKIAPHSELFCHLGFMSCLIFFGQTAFCVKLCQIQKVHGNHILPGVTE